jgi:glycosyltransferase involved in cell wall biosynthesis
VTTIHGFSSERILPAYEAYDGRTAYVAISEADRHAGLHYVATIHHGIDMRAFEVHSTPGDYLLFFGRIHPDKGTVGAIDVAERPVCRSSWPASSRMKRTRGPREAASGRRVVRYVGPVGPEARSALLGGARALLHLIDFEEPFGFSVVEAMACGTPVIAHARGSMPEIVKDGVGGYLVDSVDAAVASVGACASLDRRAVRASVERRFDVERMVDEYLEVYRRVVAEHRATTTGSPGASA